MHRNQLLTFLSVSLFMTSQAKAGAMNYLDIRQKWRMRWSKLLN
jgi:hypothetical protein